MSRKEEMWVLSRVESAAPTYFKYDLQEIESFEVPGIKWLSGFILS